MESSQVSEQGQPAPGGPRRRRWWRWLGLVLVALLAFTAYEYVRLPDAAPLQKQNPETTALIEQRAEEAREAGRKPRRKQYWVSLSNVPKHVIQAVLTSEDAAFYLHEGVDTVELERAMEEAWKQGKLGRGASTITQQLAKNLWLSTDRSLLRKAKELVLARRLENELTKSRILAIYLNVVEWGDGVYGIEAAAREHFGVSALGLSVAQGAVLAAMLPSPRKRSPKSGSRALQRRSHWIIDQMQMAKRLSPEQAAAARAELNRILGAKTEAAEDSTDEDEP
ncbi:monofunctional biosynthetic peptidoglycan transglycosylase [Hyalangium versicolor]|uniref:monofunctional biosynthetic peptidoglycan transglycosylase n=1 Tax=Hyalangium versicolor TaxID=2861190 RepID=UPI001CCBDCA8|nr:monofunctional biosynthetic peptidoglycan transglycosylase [Hyalangium versicolor]